mgnify:FL=1
MIDSATVERIKDAANIVEVVSEFVTLRRSGANYKGLCPFHDEKTPSFYVSPGRGMCHCFGCGKGGNPVGFIMEHEQMTYPEALRWLAKKYHIEIQEEEESAEEIARRQRSESLLLVSEFAEKFFVSQLDTDEGHAVGRAYFRKRGLEDETVRKFGLGWAPSGRTALVDAALAAGYKMEYLLAAGVAVRHDDETVSDKFRERVMFPVHSVSGRVVAFSGRTLRSDNPAKYVNSPETEIYIKSRNLLGIYFAKSEMSRLDECILVEGNIDMVMMHQLGIRNVVASCGTSLTVEQIRLIRKFTENVTIMYDGDSAGIHAALRGITMVLSEGMNVKVVLLPDGDDPDSFCRKHTLEEVRSFMASSEQDFISFKSELLLREAGGDPLKRANLINDIADTIAAIPDPVKRSTYVAATAERFKVESSILFDRIAVTRRKMLEEKSREEFRENRRREAEGRAASSSGQPAEVRQGTAERAWTEENRTLAAAERDLLCFLLTHGCDELDFESDSEYYSGDESCKPTVCDFIRDALESDGTKMANSAYAAVYDAYTGLYDRGLPQDVIVKTLLDSQDRRIAAVTAELSAEKYRLSVSALKDAMTTVPSWLVAQLPKTIMLYAERRIQDRINGIRRSLAEADEQTQIGLLQEMKRLRDAQLRIKKKTGREK